MNAREQASRLKLASAAAAAENMKNSLRKIELCVGAAAAASAAPATANAIIFPSACSLRARISTLASECACTKKDLNTILCHSSLPLCVCLCLSTR